MLILIEARALHEHRRGLIYGYSEPEVSVSCGEMDRVGLPAVPSVLSRSHGWHARTLKRADVLAKRMWKFIDILKPERVLIENPSSSMLWEA